MLIDLINENLIKLNIEASDWEEAVRSSAQSLISERKVKKSYIEDMITGIKENGPYIVVTKNVALPHARPESGALECAISITTLKKPVNFGNEANDPVKYLFCLSATDNLQHLSALSELSYLFEDREFFQLLDEAKNPIEIIEYIKHKRRTEHV